MNYSKTTAIKDFTPFNDTQTNQQISPNIESRYQWEKTYENLPGHVKGVPRGEGFTIFKIFIFLSTAIKGVIGLLTAQFLHLFPYLWNKLKKGEIVFTGTADLGLMAILADFNNWNNVEEFNEFFKPWTFFQKPDVAQNWQSDIEFGRQRLNGMNPILIRKCKAEDIQADGNFAVTNEIINPVRGKDIDLTSALAENRLYLLEYPIFENIMNAELEDQLGRYLQSPISLFYVDDQKQLVPIAIQLQDKTKKIFTPNSLPEDWKAGKLAVAGADVAYQGMISHLLNTHLIIEPFAVTTNRKLSGQHILYQLLKPHFFNTLPINNMARNVFLGRGGLFDNIGSLGYTGSNELLNRGYNGINHNGEKTEGLKFYQLALPYDLEQREVEQLPNYYYRDDALLVWNAIKNYVSDVLRSHYKNDAEIICDRQLQNWKDELLDNGNINGLLPPDKSDQLNTLDDLIDIATIVIFTATAQHSAVNFGQYDYAAWIPNNPFAIYKPFLDLFKSESQNKATLPQRLPNRLQSIQQIVLVKALTIAPPYSSKSLLTLTNPFSNPVAREAFHKFQINLGEIEAKISVRNTSVSQPYTYLLPSRIAQSIAI
ncbi:MAG: lipoxygenase family protein [Nostoc sp. ChiSLP02]|nr:lipoxygenase family protein [Nostoc sp. DedSLP05]MDZ8101031.1 lipoxygenase family protein [Nostoc sp. DedSLP01]MDZ8188485.1 lipoxygenase family protein [Nostoc sp. ChiSLP02]